MSIRELLNRKPAVATGAATIVIVLAVGVILWQFWPRGYRKDYKEVYYTNDEGKSWFADDINKIPPFDKRGKLAYRAQVVRCESGKPFVAFVMRYSEEDKKALDERAASRGDGDPGQGASDRMECRKPGGSDSDWGRWPSEKWRVATNVVCPDGGRGAKPILP